MYQRVGAAGREEAAAMSCFWHALHAGTSIGRDHGLHRRGLCRLLSLPPRGKCGNESKMIPSNLTEFELSCPIPISDYPSVLMAHGGGGRLTHQLIERMFVPTFKNTLLEARHD